MKLKHYKNICKCKIWKTDFVYSAVLGKSRPSSIFPSAMCSDGSDALLDGSGEPLTCGSGFDGKSLCPVGYYCSMDPERKG